MVEQGDEIGLHMVGIIGGGIGGAVAAAIAEAVDGDGAEACLREWFHLVPPGPGEAGEAVDHEDQRPLPLLHSAEVIAAYVDPFFCHRCASSSPQAMRQARLAISPARAPWMAAASLDALPLIAR